MQPAIEEGTVPDNKMHIVFNTKNLIVDPIPHGLRPFGHESASPNSLINP